MKKILNTIQNNRLYSLGFRLLILVFGITAIAMNFVISLKTGEIFKQLAYFTVQSNIFVMVLMAILITKGIIDIVKNGRNGKAATINNKIHFPIILYIMVTGLVYSLVLSWFYFGMISTSEFAAYRITSNILLHFVVPIMAVIDWLIFVPHGKIKINNLFYYLAYPMAYFLFCVVRAQSGIPMHQTDTYISYYPYPFIDIDVLGWWTIATVIGMALAIFGLAYGMKVIDDKLSTHKDKNSSSKIM